MIAIFILAAFLVTSQATPVVYRRPAAIYVQPAPISYSTTNSDTSQQLWWYSKVTEPVLLKDETPKPYSFGYEAPAIGGGSSRQETSDGSGRVTGSYTVTDADGRVRVVDYYADETGFHANVKTNEPGTANQDSADVSVQSYAAPAPAPVLAPKVVAAPAPAPLYTVAAPVRTLSRRVVSPAPVSYRVVPAYNTYNTLSYAAPVSYANGFYGHGLDPFYWK